MTDFSGYDESDTIIIRETKRLMAQYNYESLSHVVVFHSTAGFEFHIFGNLNIEIL